MSPVSIVTWRSISGGDFTAEERHQMEVRKARAEAITKRIIIVRLDASSSQLTHLTMLGR